MRDASVDFHFRSFWVPLALWKEKHTLTICLMKRCFSKAVLLFERNAQFIIIIVGSFSNSLRHAHFIFKLKATDNKTHINIHKFQTSPPPGIDTHIHVRTHARTCARARAHTHTHTRTRTHARMHTHTHLLEAGWRQLEVLGGRDRALAECGGRLPGCGVLSIGRFSEAGLLE